MGTPQTVRLQSQGTTILKQSPQGMQPKQIITVHKTGAVSSQPQIVTLVKTTQGMTVASVSGLSLFSNSLHSHLHWKWHVSCTECSSSLFLPPTLVVSNLACELFLIIQRFFCFISQQVRLGLYKKVVLKHLA